MEQILFELKIYALVNLPMVFLSQIINWEVILSQNVMKEYFCYISNNSEIFLTPFPNFKAFFVEFE